MPEDCDPRSKPVHSLTYARRKTPRARWVMLRKYVPLEAQLVQSRLQSEGIPCNLADQHTAQIYSALIGIDVRLQVLECDLNRARAIVKEMRAARVKDVGDDPYLDEDWRCSKCRSRNVGHVPLSPPMLILSLLLLGLPLLFIKRYKRCGDCGHTRPM